jgi:hypothetical protein
MPPRGHPRRRRVDPEEQNLDMCGGMPLPPPLLPPPPPYDKGYPDAAHSLAECARHLAEAMARIP